MYHCPRTGLPIADFRESCEKLRLCRLERPIIRTRYSLVLLPGSTGEVTLRKVHDWLPWIETPSLETGNAVKLNLQCAVRFQQPCAWMILSRQHLWRSMISSWVLRYVGDADCIFPYATLLWPLGFSSSFPVKLLPFQSKIILWRMILCAVHIDT